MMKRRNLRSSNKVRSELQEPSISEENFQLSGRVVSENSASSYINDNNSASGHVISASSSGKAQDFNNALSKPALRKPFEYGWVRELVYRRKKASITGKIADVYYYSPSGKRVRSTKEIPHHLTGELTLNHFSFTTQPIGLNDPTKEIIREAKLMHGPKTSDKGEPRVEALTRKDKVTLAPLKKNISNMPTVKAKPESKEFVKKQKYSGPDDYDSRYSPEVKKKEGKRENEGLLTRKNKVTLPPPQKNISNMPKAQAKPESKEFDKKRKSSGPDDYVNKYSSEGKNSKRGKREKEMVKSLSRKDKVALLPLKKRTKHVSNMPKAKAKPKSKGI